MEPTVSGLLSNQVDPIAFTKALLYLKLHLSSVRVYSQSEGLLKFKTVLMIDPNYVSKRKENFGSVIRRKKD